MAEIKNSATISVTFYHSSGATPLECLTKKYVLKNWKDEPHLRQLLAQISKELNYISGYGISSIKVKSDQLNFEYKCNYLPFQSENDNSLYLRLLGFQRAFRFQVGQYIGRGGIVKLEIPRLWNGFSGTGKQSEINDHLLLMRVTPIKSRKKSKREGSKYLLYLEQENSILLSFLKRVSENGELAPFTQKDWTSYPLLKPTSAYVSLCSLPKDQTTHCRKKKYEARESKRLRMEERERLKRERSGVIYTDQRNTKKADQVYLIKMCSDVLNEDIYKIGISNAPGKRLKSLNTASPFELEMVHRFVADPAEEAEKRLHSLYENVRMNGEWFKLTSQQVNDLKMIVGFGNGEFFRGTGTG